MKKEKSLDMNISTTTADYGGKRNLRTDTAWAYFIFMHRVHAHCKSRPTL